MRRRRRQRTHAYAARPPTESGSLKRIDQLKGKGGKAGPAKK